MRRVLAVCALLVVACGRTSSAPKIAADPARSEVGPPKDARHDCEQAARQDPRDPQLREHLRAIYQALGL